MRGARWLIIILVPCFGIIPAYAGSTCWSRFLRRWSWDHPRVCGEHALEKNLVYAQLGSSPRMRGAHDVDHLTCVRVGIIPAYAGSTVRNSDDFDSSWDHPRVCGEHDGTITDIPLSEGSSPRMRGAPVLREAGQRKDGIIPAYAGSTYNGRSAHLQCRDHPRVCGEHVLFLSQVLKLMGSSPRMRGAR